MGIGRFANLGTIWKTLIEYDDGAILLTKCGLEAVDRVVASAIPVVRAQCVDASWNTCWEYDVRGSQATWML